MSLLLLLDGVDPSGVIHGAWHVDVELNGPGAGWITLVDTLIDAGIKATRGIRGGTPKDRVASIGTLTFSVDNSEDNSAATLGLYSLGHPSALPGWRLGIGVRFVLEYQELTRIVWRGVIESILPVAGLHRERRVSVTCVDWMDEAAKAKPKDLAVMIDATSDEVFTALVGAVPKAPASTSVGTGSDVYPFSLDNVQDESTSVMSLFQKLAVSELGQIYPADDGQVVYEGRPVRGLSEDREFTFDGDKTIRMNVTSSRTDILNRILTQVHPRVSDAVATTVLFSLPTRPKIASGTSYVFSTPYKDPLRPATRVGGIDMMTPVAGTDYSFNSAEDGSGDDLTARLQVFITFGGNSASVRVLNRGGDGYLTFQLRGRGLYDFSQVVLEAGDEASQLEHGSNVFSLDMPFQSDPAVGLDAAYYFLHLNKDEKPRVRSFSYVASRSDELMRQMMAREISDRIGVAEPVTGVDADYFINSISIELDEELVLTVSHDVELADQSDYCLLDVVGRCELDSNAILGFGIFA